MRTENYNRIRNAIENKLQVKAYFQWEYREMCPHVIWIGWNEERALFCQFWWISKSKGVILPEKREWRYMALDKLSNITTDKGIWYTLDIKWERKVNWYITDIDLEVSCNLVNSEVYF